MLVLTNIHSFSSVLFTNIKQKIRTCMFQVTCAFIGPDEQTLMRVKCDYFLSHQIKHVFWVLKRTVSLIKVLLSIHNICFG